MMKLTRRIAVAAMFGAMALSGAASAQAADLIAGWIARRENAFPTADLVNEARGAQA